jgi:integrase
LIAICRGPGHYHADRLRSWTFTSAEAVVEETLPHVSAQVAAMARLQLLTGMRPGEVVVMRGLDLETSGPVWFYRPGSDRGRHGAHKNAYRGHDRVIAIGPRAQEVLRPWLRLNLQEYLFQPRESRAAHNAVRRANRKSNVPPSQQTRRPKRRPKRAPGEHYLASSYDHAVDVGCAVAHSLKCEDCRRQETDGKKEDQKAWLARIHGCPGLVAFNWHPNQLRHTKATEIRREAGIDAARAVLGHRSPAITETYAELDKGKAAEIAAKLG